MDILELFLLLVFIGFPLLQLLLNKLGLGRGEEPPSEEETEQPLLPGPTKDQSIATKERTIATKQRTIASETGQQGWSSEWGSWPAETLEDLAAEEVVSEVEADELISLQERLATHGLSEATRVSVPVVSLESLHVDRASERARMHARPMSRAIGPHRVAPPVIAGSLRSAADLRRAVVLTEVLGPPRGLREKDLDARG